MGEIGGDRIGGSTQERLLEIAARWHILMKGSIVAAGEGDLQAASRARRAGELLLVAETGPA